MKVSDDTLAAYVDGELDEMARLQVEAAMADDPALRSTVERLRRLRATLQAGFDPVLQEPIPDRLLAALQAPAEAVDNRHARVIDLATAREARRSGRRWALPEWAAIAASLLLGVLVATWLPDPPQSLLSQSSGALVAQGALAEALDRQLANEAAPAAVVGVGLSFRADDGRLCRSFAIQQTQPLAGLACQVDGNWQIPLLMDVEPGAGSGDAMRMASSALPPALLEAIDARMVGETLDAEAERRARDGGWR